MVALAVGGLVATGALALRAVRGRVGSPGGEVIGTDGDLVTRHLARGDYDKGFLQLLAQLTTVGDISRAGFDRRLRELGRSDAYAVVVIEDISQGKIVGTAQVMIESKFIHELGKVGHVEDVVVDASVRGRSLGRRVVEAVSVIAKERGCYKCILDCAESNVPFYEKLQYKRKEVQMARYF